MWMHIFIYVWYKGLSYSDNEISDKIMDFVFKNCGVRQNILFSNFYVTQKKSTNS